MQRYGTFSPDAWTVYELAQTVGGDFFRANTAREYVTGSAYSSAFAPLWSVIVSVVAQIIPNIYAGYVAAFFAYAAFAASAELFARLAFGQHGVRTRRRALGGILVGALSHRLRHGQPRGGTRRRPADLCARLPRSSAALLLLMRARSVTPSADAADDAHTRAIVLFTVAVTAPLAGYVVTGYWDHRYFTSLIWLGELFALAYVTRDTPKVASPSHSLGDCSA